MKELLIHAHPRELIPDLLADVLELRLQPQSAVRRELPEIVDGAVKVRSDACMLTRIET